MSTHRTTHTETIQMLQSLYPLPDELVLSPPTLRALQDPGGFGVDSFVCTLTVPLDPDREGVQGCAGGEGEGEGMIRLKITLGVDMGEVRVNLVSGPGGLRREEMVMIDHTLARSISHQDQQQEGEEEEDPLTRINSLIQLTRQTITRLIQLKPHLPPPNPLDPSSPSSLPSLTSPAPPTPEPLQRIYFRFPSLSTPSKRRDLVSYAEQRGLTGFVLAGKPGLLCVEGTDTVVGDYWRDIRAGSWGDIPGFQKKVSEKTRHPIPHRQFPDMQEITHLIDQRGSRGNRGDMRQVREWMERYGLGGEFGFVLGQG